MGRSAKAARDMSDSDLPSVLDFETSHIGYQQEVLDQVYNFDYKKYGKQELIMAGSVGSAKSAIAAYCGVRHCMEFSRSRLMLGRKSLPDIKDTIYKDIVEMLDCDELKEGRDYFLVETQGKVRFRNGSEIVSRSWSDRKYKKLGSLKISAAIMEELAENDPQDKKAYDFVRMRVGRLPHVPHKWLMGLTNPDEPDHWVYTDLVCKPSERRRVWKPSLKDNPFLDETYETGLREDLDPLMARRMIDNEWLSLTKDVIYYAYKQERNYRNTSYEVKRGFPVYISWDFNIGDGKPLSLVMFQYIAGEFHFFNEVVVEGMRTLDSCEELDARGHLVPNQTYILMGDATGKHKDTRSKKSDWAIIEGFFSNHKDNLKFELSVPLANPPIRTRHNKVNSHCLNANGKIRLYVYKDAPTMDKGMRLTSLKKGGQYIEDDSKDFQHITTAAGYGIVETLRRLEGLEQFGTLPRWG